MKIEMNQTSLFSFTDLVILLLFSLSLIPSSSDSITVHISEMDIPVVPSNPNLAPVEQPEETWELQVYPESGDRPTPFKLVRTGIEENEATELFSKHLERNDLIDELESLQRRSIRPILLPEKTSLTDDFLFAAAAIAKVWGAAEGKTIVRTQGSEDSRSRGVE